MSKGYKSLRETSFAEFTERKSVFYSTASPVLTEEEAISFINSVRKRYSDATHNVYAYILRENNMSRFADDGEPHGTAGLPVLEVLRKEGLTNAVVVVTRYFGGIQLGAGGLVRTYTAAAKNAVDKAGVVLWVPHAVFKVTSTYSDFQRLSYLFKTEGVSVNNTQYTDQVSAERFIEEQYLEKVIQSIHENSGRRAQIEILQNRFMPAQKEVNSGENN